MTRGGPGRGGRARGRGTGGGAAGDGARGDGAGRSEGRAKLQQAIAADRRGWCGRGRAANRVLPLFIPTADLVGGRCGRSWEHGGGGGDSAHCRPAEARGAGGGAGRASEAGVGGDGLPERGDQPAASTSTRRCAATCGVDERSRRRRAAGGQVGPRGPARAAGEDGRSLLRRGQPDRRRWCWTC